MDDLIRQIFMLFGARYVTLIDHDGDRHIRRVLFRGGRAFARRVDFDIGNAWLLDDGKTSGVCYVTGWEPYEPGVEPVWPHYSYTD